MSAPETEAIKVLGQYWKDRDIPVDPIAIANSMGIEVYADALDERVSGALVKRVAQPPRILIRSDDSPKRQRFTCAHELGHYVQRGSVDVGDDYEYVDLRAEVDGAPSIDETFANQFAAELLMPRREVKILWSLSQDVTELAQTFNMSQPAMAIRLKNLHLIP